MTMLVGNEKELFTLVIPLFRVMRPVKVEDKYSATETLKDLVARAPYKIDDKWYTRSKIRQVMVDFYDLDRDLFSEDPMFSHLTPVGLWVMKDMMAIKYEEWDKEDISLKYLTSRKLEQLPNIAELDKQEGLANIEYRVPKVMILDNDDWDLVPNALDQEIEW